MKLQHLVIAAAAFGLCIVATPLNAAAPKPKVKPKKAEPSTTRRKKKQRPPAKSRKARTGARNVIVFIGDGMGVSTVTATRIYSVGLEGELTMDRFPYTALSRTYTSDHFTPDSAGTMSAMMTGLKTNSGIISLGPKTERNDFNQDGDGKRPWTLLELAKRKGMRVGVVSTARITHATPAATYAHINERNRENEIALQALPGDPSYNQRLGKGIDLIFGGGRQFFVPDTQIDEEGSAGRRVDGRDLRTEFQQAGYHYIHNDKGFAPLERKDLPVLALFESSHMEYEYDRKSDQGGEPSLSEMTVKAVDLLASSCREQKNGYFLMIESGRIDHAHHASNAFRAITDTEEFDKAIAAAVKRVNLRDTLIIVTADHSHVFSMAGYPVRPAQDLPYRVKNDGGYKAHKYNILDVVYGINVKTGEIGKAGDAHGTPYTILGYQNGGGFRGRQKRVDPAKDPHPGLHGQAPSGPTDPQYRQEAAVPLASETHAGEEVTMYAVGPMAHLVRGTVKNTHLFTVVAKALGLQ